jgi:hypothetical protein
MELTKYAKVLKEELNITLTKQGKCLHDLEHALRNINTGEGVYKVAEIATSMTGNLLGIASTVPETLFKGSLAGGGLTGLALDEMDKSVQDINKALSHEREKVHMIKRITENLKREHGII